MEYLDHAQQTTTDTPQHSNIQISIFLHKIDLYQRPLYTEPMVFLRQHIFLAMLVTAVLLFSMSATHCAWIFQVSDEVSASLFFSHSELAEDSQEDTHASPHPIIPLDVLITYLSVFQPRLLSKQLTPLDQVFHLPQVYLDIFVPPQKNC